MSLIQHRDETVRFRQQLDNARDHVLPFIGQALPLREGLQVLDIGCGDGGVMVPFLEKGCLLTGIELDPAKSEIAKRFLSDYIAGGQCTIVNRNIYDAEALAEYRGRFDLIVLKDVIEHIPDQERFIPYLSTFLKPGGHIFFGFPPWYMPHGGHQQVCGNKLLSVLPWFHLLPASLYKGILKLGREPEPVIRELLEIKDTGISIERFERIAGNSGYTTALKKHYLVNPIYRYKFGWEPREQAAWVSRLPWIRDVVTTCVYYLLRYR